jgi:hypothetical protein
VRNETVSFSELRRIYQQNLESFLTVELDLMDTLCGMAENQADPEHPRRLRFEAEKAIRTVKYFSKKVTHRAARKSILDRMRDVELRILKMKA